MNFRCLTSCFRPPQNGILYVLTVSRRGNDCARYQSAAPCSFDSLELFAHTFQEYFEGDARHHLWFIDVPTGVQLVYDNHDLIYSYGNDDSVISIVKSKGLSEGNSQIPWPHEHCYNEEFDASEGNIMEYCERAKFPLRNMIIHNPKWQWMPRLARRR